jgi:hypothetical protein
MRRILAHMGDRCFSPSRAPPQGEFRGIRAAAMTSTNARSILKRLLVLLIRLTQSLCCINVKLFSNL